MPRTIQDAVDASGHVVGLDELVNFGRVHRKKIDPSTSPRSYWFRFGDIRLFTLPQLQAAIGGLASAGQLGGAQVLRVSVLPSSAFVRHPGTGFFGLDEYTRDTPVVVKLSINVS
jgi:hypothetical protein